MAQYPQDVNFTPDFPTAAPLFAEMYRSRSGTSVDGVLAIDPVALSYTLKGTPPIDVGDGVTVTADNLVPILLSTAYARFDEVDQSQRDDFLAHATSQVFSAVMSGKGDPRSIINGLRKAASERRILVYSAHPDEQAEIATTGPSGAINADLAAPSIGVFFNDGTAAKLGYYLSSEAHVTEGKCRTDGRRELQVRVVMHYDAPASGLPPYVTGSSPGGRSYTLRTNVLVFAPVGGGVVNVERDGELTGMGRGEDHAREVGTVTVELAPGASTRADLHRCSRRPPPTARSTSAASADADAGCHTVGHVDRLLPGLRCPRQLIPTIGAVKPKSSSAVASRQLSDGDQVRRHGQQ